MSGWQSSSTASTTNEPGPDLADYPMGLYINEAYLSKFSHFRSYLLLRMIQNYVMNLHRYGAQQSGSTFQGATFSRQETTACSFDYDDVKGARIFSTDRLPCSNHCRRRYRTRWNNCGKIIYEEVSYEQIAHTDSHV